MNEEGFILKYCKHININGQKYLALGYFAMVGKGIAICADELVPLLSTTRMPVQLINSVEFFNGDDLLLSKKGKYVVDNINGIDIELYPVN